MTTNSYKDSTKPVDERVDDLLARMHLDEKLAQLGSLWVFELLDNQRFSDTLAADKLNHGIGQITRIGGASNVNPTESAALANQIQAFLKESTRLGIPAMVHEECCSGYMANGATLFPQAIGIASTWDDNLTQTMGDSIRQQVRSVGGHQALAPVLDVTRDPRWGRVEETFGEDPYLVSKLGTAYIRGIQGDDFSQRVIATGKHFLGYGMSEGGRNWAPVFLPQRELLEIFALPFEVAIKEAGLLSVMNAYHELDGVPCGSSKALMVDLLRERLGFNGLVVSDYFTVDTLAHYHGVAKDKAAAASLALDAGIDVELPTTDCYGAPLRAALEVGEIDIALVDRAVRRTLELKFRLGLFENPFVDTNHVSSVFLADEHQTVAYHLAQKSMVLLKNADQTLPLDKSLKSIAVIGPNAHTVRNLMGDYSYPAHIESLMQKNAFGNFGSSAPDGIKYIERPVEMETILESIRGKVAPETEVKYAPGCTVAGNSTEDFDEAVIIAAEAEVAIVVVGDKAGLTDDCTCGEARDRADIVLPGVQQALVQAIIATGTPVVLVLINGRPVGLSAIIDEIPAVLEGWLPGEKGANAVADVLFGDYNPGGKLPISFPRSVGQIPLFYNHKPSGGRSHWKEDYADLSVHPLFPFGYGLSYTQFEFSKLQLDRTDASAGEQVRIQVEVTNTGDRAGDEAAQLYVRYRGTSMTRPVKELKGYKRITLEPGEGRQIVFILSINQLAFLDQAMEYVIEPGSVDIMIGNSSEDIHCQATLNITGERTGVGSRRDFFSTVELH